MIGIAAQVSLYPLRQESLSTVDLVAVEGNVLRVRGLDAIDGTPVLDLKPA